LTERLFCRKVAEYTPRRAAGQSEGSSRSLPSSRAAPAPEISAAVCVRPCSPTIGLSPTIPGKAKGSSNLDDVHTHGALGFGHDRTRKLKPADSPDQSQPSLLLHKRLRELHAARCGHRRREMSHLRPRAPSPLIESTKDDAGHLAGAVCVTR
jgi:hypothetical protein